MHTPTGEELSICPAFQIRVLKSFQYNLLPEVHMKLLEECALSTYWYNKYFKSRALKTIRTMNNSARRWVSQSALSDKRRKMGWAGCVARMREVRRAHKQHFT